MADRPLTDRPMTSTLDEGSRGGRNSVLLVAFVAAVLVAFLLFFGLRYNSGGQNAAPNASQPSTEAPVTAPTQNP